MFSWYLCVVSIELLTSALCTCIVGFLLRSNWWDTDCTSTEGTSESTVTGNNWSSWSPTPPGEGQRSPCASSTAVPFSRKLGAASRYQRGSGSKSPLDL